jgi:S1-C subfamily serine protease
LSQNSKPDYQNNSNLDFTNFLSGVKYAYVALADATVDDISNGKSPANASAILGIIKYLKEIGFDDVKWGKILSSNQNIPSLCDLVIVSPSWGYSNNSYTDIKLTFISCNNDIFRFDVKKNIAVNVYSNIQTAFYNRCLEMYGFKKSYHEKQRLSLPSEITDWDEERLKRYFQERGVDQFEGIYESAIATDQMPKYKLGLIKTGSNYNLIYLSGATNSSDWLVGEIKAKLSPTATESLFKADWKMKNKSINNNAYISFETGLMNLAIQSQDKSVYIKLYPTASEGLTVSNTSPSSGTGFGISSTGLIVTNSHVINKANKIKVRGVGGDFSKSMSAKIIIEDKNNDLALIQIIDSSFISLGTIPYTIKNKSSDVGSSVFVLGYPLKAVMGDEIKLTNGIISSKSGFQGDVTSYQISVPLQPGNSGGPLFDSSGNVIGIVNAKLTIGENVSYAIKSPYLLNLIDLLPTMPKLTTVNLLVGKQLTEQVKSIRNFVYIIEIN